MSSDESDPELPHRLTLEFRHQVQVVTFDDHGVTRAGGMCRCCGCGPDAHPVWRAEPWYIYAAGLCDADGVPYAMLCQDCLDSIRAENAGREKTLRDEQAKILWELFGDDYDGFQTTMEDDLPPFDPDESASDGCGVSDRPRNQAEPPPAPPEC